MSSLSHVFMLVGDLAEARRFYVDAEYARLTAAGVPFDGPPVDQEWGARHAWLRDPDGRRLSIFTGDKE